VKFSSTPYDLCVIGAGIAGLNALFVAKQYLKPSARVALIDRNEQAGGMWNSTYDYVRLHQPYSMFTAGNIPWEISKPQEYLATGNEVLRHLRSCLETISKDLQVDTFWRSEVTHIAEIETEEGNLGSVSLCSLCSDAAQHHLRANRVILAKGLDVPTLAPLELSSGSVKSCSPQTMSNHLNSTDPVYIIGGGNTGMD